MHRRQTTSSPRTPINGGSLPWKNPNSDQTGEPSDRPHKHRQSNSWSSHMPGYDPRSTQDISGRTAQKPVRSPTDNRITRAALVASPEHETSLTNVSQEQSANRPALALNTSNVNKDDEHMDLDNAEGNDEAAIATRNNLPASHNPSSGAGKQFLTADQNQLLSEQEHEPIVSKRKDPRLTKAIEQIGDMKNKLTKDIVASPLNQSFQAEASLGSGAIQRQEQNIQTPSSEHSNVPFEISLSHFIRAEIQLAETNRERKQHCRDYDVYKQHPAYKEPNNSSFRKNLAEKKHDIQRLTKKAEELQNDLDRLSKVVGKNISSMKQSEDQNRNLRQENETLKAVLASQSSKIEQLEHIMDQNQRSNETSFLSREEYTLDHKKQSDVFEALKNTVHQYIESTNNCAVHIDKMKTDVNNIDQQVQGMPKASWLTEELDSIKAKSSTIDEQLTMMADEQKAASLAKEDADRVQAAVNHQTVDDIVKLKTQFEAAGKMATELIPEGSSNYTEAIPELQQRFEEFRKETVSLIANLGEQHDKLHGDIWSDKGLDGKLKKINTSIGELKQSNQVASEEWQKAATTYTVLQESLANTSKGLQAVREQQSSATTHGTEIQMLSANVSQLTDAHNQRLQLIEAWYPKLQAELAQMAEKHSSRQDNNASGPNTLSSRQSPGVPHTRSHATIPVVSDAHIDTMSARLTAVETHFQALTQRVDGFRMEDYLALLVGAMRKKLPTGEDLDARLSSLELEIRQLTSAIKAELELHETMLKQKANLSELQDVSSKLEKALTDGRSLHDNVMVADLAIGRPSPEVTTHNKALSVESLQNSPEFVAFMQHVFEEFYESHEADLKATLEANHESITILTDKQNEIRMDLRDIKSDASATTKDQKRNWEDFEEFKAAFWAALKEESTGTESRFRKIEKAFSATLSRLNKVEQKIPRMQSPQKLLHEREQLASSDGSGSKLSAALLQRKRRKLNDESVENSPSEGGA